MTFLSIDTNNKLYEAKLNAENNNKNVSEINKTISDNSIFATNSLQYDLSVDNTNSINQNLFIPDDEIVDSFEYQTSDINANARELYDELEQTREDQGIIGKLWDGFKNLTGLGAGSNKAEDAIKQYENGEISLEEAKEKLNGYQQGQETCVDVVGDIVSGIVAVGAFALAVPTGGTSLIAGLGLAAAAGAGSKIAVKAGDAIMGGREYSGKDLLYDAGTGAVNGLFAPVTNGVGACVTKTVGKKLGLTVVKEGTKEAIEQGAKQGLKSIITQQGVDVIGGTFAKRAAATAAGMAVDGAIGGSTDNMIRAALDGEDLAGILQAGVEGAAGGLIMSPVIGGGFKVAGKLGKKVGSEIFGTNVVAQAADIPQISTSKSIASDIDLTPATSSLVPDEAIAAATPLAMLSAPNVAAKQASDTIQDEIEDVAPAALKARPADVSELLSKAKKTTVGTETVDLYHAYYEPIDKAQDAFIAKLDGILADFDSTVSISQAEFNDYLAQFELLMKKNSSIPDGIKRTYKQFIEACPQNSEEVLTHKIELMRFLNTIGVMDMSDETVSGLNQIYQRLFDAKKEYATVFTEAIKEQSELQLGKNMPNIDAVIDNISQAYGINRTQAAELVEGMTRFSSLRDFKSLLEQVKANNETLLVSDDTGFDQAVAYLFGKLDTDDVKFQKRTMLQEVNASTADYSQKSIWDKFGLDPDKKYVFFADSTSAEGIYKTQIPENVRVVNVGNIKDGCNMITSFSETSIYEKFDALMKANDYDIQKAMAALSSDVQFEGSVDEILQKRFSIGNGSVSHEYEEKLYEFIKNEGWTTTDIENALKHEYEMSSIIDNEDISYILRNIAQTVEEGSQGKKLYTVIAPSSPDGKGVKSQHYLLYKLKIMMGDDVDIYQMKYTTVNKSQNTAPFVFAGKQVDFDQLVYIDDFAASGESFKNIIGRLSRTVSDDQQLIVAPMVTNDVSNRTVTNYLNGNLAKSLGQDGSQRVVYLTEPSYKVANNGLSSDVSAKKADALLAMLDQQSYVRVDKSLYNSIKNHKTKLPKDVNLYHISHGIADPANGGKTIIPVTSVYASRVAPSLAIADVTGYNGSATGVLLPYMASNTNSCLINLLFRDILGDDLSSIVKYHNPDIPQTSKEFCYTYRIISKD